MNVANAFALACSGSINERDINQYASYVNTSFERVNRLGGWLGRQAEQTMGRFNEFVTSRAWEFSKRIFGQNDGEYVSRFEVGYLGSINGLQQATGLMRDYIMADPTVMQLYLDERIDGYGGEFSNMCSGLGRDNLMYRRAYNGVVGVKKNEAGEYSGGYSHYNDSITGNGLSQRERFELQRTYRALAVHTAKATFDFTNPLKGEFKPLKES